MVSNTQDVGAGDLGDAPTITTTFPLGRVVVTRGVQEKVGMWKVMRMLRRHARRDWGVISPIDAAQNDWAVIGEERLLSAYPIRSYLPCKGHGDNCVWIITEADRSVTTVLLPEEY